MGTLDEANQQSSSTASLSREKKKTTGLQKENVKNKHNNSFKYESKRNSTGLSNFKWGKRKEKNNVDLD